MDVAVIHQYGFLLALVAAGVALAFAAGIAIQSKSAAAGSRVQPDAGAGRRFLPRVMLLLVALAAMAAVVLLLPAAMIFRFLDHPAILASILGCLVLIIAPLLYAWRTRPFA